MKKNILVTGGAGFIGSHISISLKNQGHNVIVLDNFYRNSHIDILKKKKIKIVKGDIRLSKCFGSINSKIDQVVHLAAINGTQNFYKHPCEVLEVATKGIFNVLDYCLKKKIKDLIIASSSEVYNIPTKIPTLEEEPIKIPDVFNPRFSYSTGKIVSEIAGINYGKKYFKRLIIFRPHNVYGKNMGSDHVIPELISKVEKSNHKLEIIGTGRDKRSFIYIEDFIKAFNLIYNKGRHMNIYNIGTEQVISINSLAKKIMKLKNKNLSIIKNNNTDHKGSTNIRCPSINKIKKLGFIPSYDLDKGLEKILNG